LAWDGEFLRVRGDLREGRAGHHVREEDEMAMIFPSPASCEINFIKTPTKKSNAIGRLSSNVRL
jgi:hypothetical protein